MKKERKQPKARFGKGCPKATGSSTQPKEISRPKPECNRGQMTGPQVLFGDDGKTRASNTLLQGKRQGPSTLFHPDGSVSDNLFYSADKLNGPATGWWPDGLPRYTANWRDGQLDGPSIENFPSGMKKSETFYRFGKKEGVARQWDERGTLLTEENWQSDQLDGRVREFFSDGKPRSLTPYLAGKKNGRYESFNPDGTLATSGEFLDGKLQGPITLHYPTGQPFAVCDYQADLLTGGRLLYPDGKELGQFGPISGKEGKVSFLLLQYPDGKPLSTDPASNPATGKMEWKGWRTPTAPNLARNDLHLSPTTCRRQFFEASQLPLERTTSDPWNSRLALPYLPNLIFFLRYGRTSRPSLPFPSAYGTVASTFKNPFVPMVNVASYCSYPDGNPVGCGMLFEEITDPVNPTAKSVADFTAYSTPLLCK